MNSSQTQVISPLVWQRIGHLKLRWWQRPLLALLALILTAASALLLLVGAMLHLSTLLTCGWIRPLHRAALKAMRRVRWCGVLSSACFIGVVSPALAIALLISFCLLRSYDFPERWLDRVSRWVR